MPKKTLQVYVSEENIEKVTKIQNYLNSKSDVLSGDISRWRKRDIYELLLNDAIEKFNIPPE